MEKGNKWKKEANREKKGKVDSMEKEVKANMRRGREREGGRERVREKERERES